MWRIAVLPIVCALLVQDPPDAAGAKAKLHDELAAAAEETGQQLLKLKAWDEARAFLEIIRAKSDARADALDKLVAKTDKQTSGLKWESKPSDLIKAYGTERAKSFLAFAKEWKEKDAEASRWTEAEGQILGDLLDYVKAYARLTQIRAHYELPKTRFSWILSVPAFWHAEYKRLNPSDGTEIDGNPGFTREGKISGQNSITSRGEPLTQLIEAVIHGPFHRTMILHPSLGSIGLGQSKDKQPGSVADVLSELIKERPTKPIAIPPHNTTGVPPAAFDDNLQIIPDRSMRDLGYPVTLTFYDPLSSPQNVRATLLENLTVVECYVSTPDKPALPKRYPNNRNSVILLPKSKLKNSTEYTVRVSYVLNGSESQLEWKFRTGR